MNKISDNPVLGIDPNTVSDIKVNRSELQC